MDKYVITIILTRFTPRHCGTTGGASGLIDDVSSAAVDTSRVPHNGSDCVEHIKMSIFDHLLAIVKDF